MAQSWDQVKLRSILLTSFARSRSFSLSSLAIISEIAIFVDKHSDSKSPQSWTINLVCNWLKTVFAKVCHGEPQRWFAFVSDLDLVSDLVSDNCCISSTLAPGKDLTVTWFVLDPIFYPSILEIIESHYRVIFVFLIFDSQTLFIFIWLWSLIFTTSGKRGFVSDVGDLRSFVANHLP